MPLRNVPDVIGLVGRREGAAESRVLQGRDFRSVRVLVPDCRGVDQTFHDVRRAYWRRRPVCVMEPPVVNIPVLTIQDPLAAAGVVVLDCQPPLLPVSIEPLSSGGGGLDWIDLSGAWRCSTSGPWD